MAEFFTFPLANLTASEKSIEAAIRTLPLGQFTTELRELRAMGDGGAVQLIRDLYERETVRRDIPMEPLLTTEEWLRKRA